MPRFKEYTAPDKAFSEDSAGYSAFETAGRRVGPLYNAAGQDLRQAGEAGVRAARVSEALANANDKLASDNVRTSEDSERTLKQADKQRISDLTWPYDILALQQGSGSSRSSRGGGGGMKLAGSVNPEIDNRLGGYANDSGSGGRASSPARMSHAAAGLGQLANGLAQRAPYSRPDGRGRGAPPAEQTFDSDGNLIYDSSQRQTDRHSYGSYLQNGQLVHTRDGQAERLPQGFDPNGAADANRWAYGDPHVRGDRGMANGQGIPTTGDYAGVNPGYGPDYGGGQDAPEASSSSSSWQTPWSPITPEEISGFNNTIGNSGWWSGIANSIGSAFGGGGSSSSGGSDEYGEE